MRGQLFTLLPPPRPRWRSFLAGWSVEILVLIGLFILGSRIRPEIIADQPFRVTRLTAYTPLIVPEQQPVTVPVVIRPAQHSNVAPKIEQPVESEPAVQALVVTRQVRVIRESKAPEAEPAAPQLKLQSKLPSIPSAPTTQVIAVGTFSSKDSLEAPARLPGTVEAAGFGDVSGVSKSQGRGGPGGKGQFGLPTISGPGDGMAATPVVMASGFASPVTVATVKSPAITKPAAVTNTPVEITFKPKPDYTEEGRKQRVNGEVQLQVLFSADGRVHVMKVVRGLGYGLDEQAVKAAEQIKFKPALHDGQAIDTTALVHIIFELVS